MNKEKLELMMNFNKHHVCSIKADYPFCPDSFCFKCKIADECSSAHIDIILTCSDIAHLEEHYPEFCV